MGGLGSGYWDRWGTKDTTEQCHRVDIRYLKREGLLKPGYFGSLTWSRGGEETGSIRYRIEQNRMVLLYRHRPYGHEWEDVEESVYFDRTPCHYGGERRWFICPIAGCGRRVGVLYGAGKYFACRHCYDLGYESQREDRYGRAIRRQHKIIERLGGDISDYFYPDKPKGMHWKTYDRLIAEAQYYEQMTEEHLAKWIGLLRG